MEKQTLFTKIIDRDIPADIVYEDEKHIAFFDINPFEKGHTLVVPKKPYETIMDMPENEFLDMMRIVKKIANHFEKELHCGINIWQNNKNIAGQEIMHVHFHVIPRTEKKRTYVLENCVKYQDNEVQNYLNRLRLK